MYIYIKRSNNKKKKDAKKIDALSYPNTKLGSANNSEHETHTQSEFNKPPRLKSLAYTQHKHYYSIFVSAIVCLKQRSMIIKTT